MQKDLKKFLTRSFLFLLPLILFFGCLTFILLAAGELVSIKEIVRMQKNSEDQILLGLAYSNPDIYFKTESALERSPKILVLGASRTMQFRSLFFKNPDEFYNAGGAVEKIEDFNKFLEKLPFGKEPKIIIIGLDHHFFNPNINNFEENSAEKPKFWGVWQNGIKGLIKDYLKRKFSLAEIISSRQGSEKFGLNAIINNDGFLNDGSYHYTKYIVNPESNPDYQFKDTLLRIDTGTRRFQYSNEVSEKAIEELDGFLKSAKERNIYIVGFLPPYAHLVYEKMSSMGDKYGYIKKLDNELSPLFSNYGFKFYDFSDINSAGSSDKEAIDGFHGSEKTYVRMLILMLEKNAELREAADKNYLKKMLDKSDNNYYVF